MNKHKNNFLIILSIALIFTMFTISCEKNSLEYSDDIIASKQPLPNLSKTSDLENYIIMPLIEKLLDNMEWVDEHTLQTIKSKDYIPLSNLNLKTPINLKEMQIPEEYPVHSETMFWYDNALYEVVIEVAYGSKKSFKDKSLSAIKNKFGIAFDTDFFSDDPVGTVYTKNLKSNKTDSKKFDLSKMPNYPVFLVCFYEKPKKDSILAKPSVTPGYYLVLYEIMAYTKNEGSSCMEVELYTGRQYSGEYYYSGYPPRPSFPVWLFDGDNRNDAAGRDRTFMDINDKRKVYRSTAGIAILRLTSNKKMIIAIEDDKTAGQHKNDESGSDYYGSYHIHDNCVTGWSFDPYGPESFPSRKFYITGDPSNDDDVFWDSELEKLTINNVPSGYLYIYTGDFYYKLRKEYIQ